MSMPSAGTAVAITVEPAGGSPRPTGDPIVVVDPEAI
jgi:anti-sigma-K factor RskA